MCEIIFLISRLKLYILIINPLFPLAIFKLHSRKKKSVSVILEFWGILSSTYCTEKTANEKDTERVDAVHILTNENWYIPEIK